MIVLWLAVAAAPVCYAGAAEDAALNKYYMLRLKHDSGALKAIEGAARAFPGNLTIQLEFGYAVLKRKDYSAARTAFRRAVRIAPRRVDLWKQLGYIDINLGNTDDAIDAFQHASTLEPGDQDLLLQLAYLQDQKGHQHEAAVLFHKVMYGSDKQKAKTGCKAYSSIRGLPEKLLPKPWFSEFYAMPEYIDRNALVVGSATLRVGQHYGSERYIDIYGLGRINADTRSGQSAIGTQLFLDNYAELGGGIRVKPLADLPLAIYAEAGAAYDTVKQARPRWREDLRVYAAYYDEWNMGLDCGEAVRILGGLRPVADAYADIGYYTRYDNMLTSARVRPGIRLFENDTSAIDLYAIAAINWDSNGVGSNRYGELGVGLALRLFEPTRLVVRIEGVRNLASSGPDYSLWRALLEYSLNF